MKRTVCTISVVLLTVSALAFFFWPAGEASVTVDTEGPPDPNSAGALDREGPNDVELAEIADFNDPNLLVVHVNQFRPDFYLENGYWKGRTFEVVVKGLDAMKGKWFFTSYIFVPCPDPNDRFAGLRNGTAHMAVGGCSDTPLRREEFPCSLTLDETTLVIATKTDADIEAGGNMIAYYAACTKPGSRYWMFAVFLVGALFVAACQSHKRLAILPGGLLLVMVIVTWEGMASTIERYHKVEVEKQTGIETTEDLIDRKGYLKRNTTSSKKVLDLPFIVEKDITLLPTWEAARDALIASKTGREEYVVYDKVRVLHDIKAGYPLMITGKELDHVERYVAYFSAQAPPPSLSKVNQDWESGDPQFRAKMTWLAFIRAFNVEIAKVLDDAESRRARDARYLGL